MLEMKCYNDGFIHTLLFRRFTMKCRLARIPNKKFSRSLFDAHSTPIPAEINFDLQSKSDQHCVATRTALWREEREPTAPDVRGGVSQRQGEAWVGTVFGYFCANKTYFKSIIDFPGWLEVRPDGKEQVISNKVSCSTEVPSKSLLLSKFVSYWSVMFIHDIFLPTYVLTR